MILAAIIDGWAFKVPNWLTLSLVVSGWLLGILHDCGVAIDAGRGGIGYSLLGTAVGFFLLFPILFIGGMGQGDVKMQMGFGSWLGAFFGSGLNAFGGHDALMILLYAFCAGTIVGGVFGLVIMVLLRLWIQRPEFPRNRHGPARAAHSGGQDGRRASQFAAPPGCASPTACRCASASWGPWRICTGWRNCHNWSHSGP